jgi:hypothetical protein
MVPPAAGYKIFIFYSVDFRSPARRYSEQDKKAPAKRPFNDRNEEKVMKSIRTLSIWALGILVAGVIWLGLAGITAQASDKSDTNATAAFAKLKTLAGTWEATTKQGKTTTTYEVVSNGSALVEHLDMPGKSSMVTVYHLDGNRLVLTHYCTAGNQPHMQADAYNPASNQIAFNFAGGGNLSDPNTGHMHSVLLKFSSADAFTADWAFQKDGHAVSTENIEYHRVK